MKHSIFEIARCKFSQIHTSYLALGSNLGNRFKNMNKAVSLLNDYSDLQVLNTSQIYKSPCIDLHGKIAEGENEFLNAVVKIKTTYGPEELLKVCKAIEKKLGRIRKEKHHSARQIDIDILCCEDNKYESDSLKIPHPRMYEREFVLRPLIDAADYTLREKYLPYIERLMMLNGLDFYQNSILRKKKLLHATKCLYVGNTDQEISSVQRIVKLEVSSHNIEDLKYLLSKLDSQMIELIDSTNMLIDQNFLRKAHDEFKKHTKVKFVCFNLQKVCQVIFL